MFIGFDIGNTSTVMGLYLDGSVMPVRIFRYDTVKAPDTDKLSAEVERNLDMFRSSSDACDGIRSMAFSSVVPEVNLSYHEMSQRLFGFDAYEISHQSNLSIKINYRDPSKLGVDRIVNAEAVFREYGGPSIIVDIGTAATFCVLLRDGTFDGGLIAPGIGTTIDALAHHASRLPAIVFGPPDSLVARDTENALKSGFFYGWLSLVEGIVSRIENEYGQDFQVILTGGYGGVIAKHLERETQCDTFLTMKGIKHISDMNPR